MGLLNEYVVPIVVVICLCVGYIVKKWIKDVDNKFIPTIVTVLGIIIALWNNYWVVTPEVIAIGLVSGLASTGMYELVTQFINGKNKDDDVIYIDGSELDKNEDGSDI